ncbi:MAG: hypothetical protein HXY34_02605 [Candidatus Thorarchaeota archaeon]|nr:hypothetical protein [Candidatus Thorarchaeota archaeon]
MKTRPRLTNHIVGVALAASLVMLGLIPSAVTAQTTVHTPLQVAEPLEEIYPGVYLYWEWWNETSEDYDYYMPSNTTGEYSILVQDIYNNTYYIHEHFYSYYESEWSFKNLLVIILVDPDASYVNWLSGQPEGWDIWMIYWMPNADALTGDEVFVYSGFYYSYYYSYADFRSNYTWCDEVGNPVDPDTVIPLLSEEYWWAQYYVNDYNYTGEWTYYSYGYDVNEMAVQNNTVHWMNHYFSGLSCFNDTNGNGIMDTYYDLVEYDWNQDGIIDWTYYEVNRTLSEKVYDFYSDTAQLGEVREPFVNENGQIEWSAEVVDIEGYFTDGYPVIYYYDGTDASFGVLEAIPDPVVIPVNLERMEMVYRFEVTDVAAVLKIDQHIGEFTDPTTGEVHPAVLGLGMTLNYWSSFSSHEISPFTPEPTYTTYPEDGVTAPGDSTYTTPSGDVLVPIGRTDDFVSLPQGSLLFNEDDDSLVRIDFGGEYLWGKDSAVYDVGTITLPEYGVYGMGTDGVPSASDVSGASEDIWQYGYFYYSSCYAHWDGYSVTHDPVFSVYPAKAPGSMSSLITGILTASIVIGVVGAIAFVAVCIRTNSTRREF